MRISTCDWSGAVEIPFNALIRLGVQCLGISLCVWFYKKHHTIIGDESPWYECERVKRVRLIFQEGKRTAEAFVFLNHYLDITDAIVDGQNELVDDTDLQGTDFPTDVPLPRTMHVDAERHEQVREWILTNAMDRDANQVKQPMGGRLRPKGIFY